MVPMEYVQRDHIQFYVQTLSFNKIKSTKKQSAQITAMYVYSVVQGSCRIGWTEYVHRSRQYQKSNSKCQTSSLSSSILRAGNLPAVGAVLGRPGPLRLVTMSIAGWLGLATSRLHVTARYVATGWLWAGAVATSSSGGEWRVGAVVVARASGEWRVRSVAVTGRCVGSSVSDNYSRGLAVTKSDGGSLSGAVTSVGARARARA